MNPSTNHIEALLKRAVDLPTETLRGSPVKDFMLIESMERLRVDVEQAIVDESVRVGSSAFYALMGYRAGCNAVVTHV